MTPLYAGLGTSWLRRTATSSHDCRGRCPSHAPRPGSRRLCCSRERAWRRHGPGAVPPQPRPESSRTVGPPARSRRLRPTTRCGGDRRW
eukprot:scaffold16048_cov110-Isochrysis_galbana.AAC.4